MQSALASVPGVRKATVDLKSKTAEVIYEPDQTSVATLIAEVEKAGFKAQPRDG